ncbi:MAG: DUF6020 family protein [Lachnospiraceae bacterium]|nr:DUF6020 family protein [Lachnospiraceae bacterium]
MRAIIAYLITFAVYNTGGFSASDILMGLIFAGTYMLLGLLPDGKKGPTEILQDSIYSQIRGKFGSDADFNKKLSKASGAVTFIWTALYVVYMGGRINRDLDNPLFRTVYTVLTVLGLYIAMYLVIRSILVRLLFVEIRPGTGRFDPKIWLKYTLIIFAFMLPLFILNHPGTLTVDSFEQLMQAQGVKAYSDHHPWVHTMIIKALYSVGYALSNSVYGGIATYTLFQMLTVAMATAYAIESMTEGYDATDPKGKRIRLLMLCAFILYPYNLAYSITMWKDVLFAASVLVLTVTLYRVYVVNNGFKARDIVLLTISGLLMCLLRHNGLYAYILTMIVILVRELVQRKRVIATIAVVVGTLIAVALVRGPIQRANNVEAGDFAHNIPIPLQQVARVVYDGNELTDEETEALLKINTIDFLREEYTPGGADPVIQWVMFGDHEYLLNHKAEYISLWLKLGLRYPDEYLRAYIDQTKGYYTTMAPEQTEYYGIMPNSMDLETKPILGAGIRIKTDEILSKLHGMIPVYGILYSMGACFMLLILGMAICVMRDKKGKIIIYLPVLTLTLTLLVATPLCADLRYAYPLMLCMPTLFVATVGRD